MKNRTIISLLGEQAIVNVLFIKTYILHNPGKYEVLFIPTERECKKRTEQNIIDALNHESITKHSSLSVIEDDAEDIKNKLQNIFIPETEYIIDMTCGTKIMAITAHEFFKGKGCKEIYYVSRNTHSNESRILNLIDKSREMEISCTINIEEYLTAYGITIDLKTCNQCLKTFKENSSFKKKTEGYKDVLSKLVKFQNTSLIKNKGSTDSIKIADEKIQEALKEKRIDTDELRKLIQTAGFKEPQFTVKNLRYLTGGWFEEYIYQKIKEEKRLPDAHILLNVKIKKGDVENEFDVIYIEKNVLNIIECKSFITDEDKILADTLYKSQALRREFGLSVNSYIYTMSVIDKKSIRDRAQNFNIKIYDKEELG